MLALVVLGGMMLAGVQPAIAQGVGCETKGLGTNAPILTVHGFNSNPGAWSQGAPSMLDIVSKIPGGWASRAFDYERVHLDWVTHLDIGPKLAQTIDCYAQASRKNGGKGKVIVIAHSMGGLATQFAAGQSIEGRSVGDEIGFFIPIATPFMGSVLGNVATSTMLELCKAPARLISPALLPFVTKERCIGDLATDGLSISSDQLRQLPTLPAKIPVRAIAGNVTATTPFFNTHIVETQTDMVVAVPSAVANVSKGGLGGKKVIDCRSSNQFVFFTDASCAHNNLLRDTAVQEEVRKAIQEYLASASSQKPMTNLFGLGLQLGTGWEVLGKKDDPSADVRKVVIKKPCDPQRYRLYCDGFVVANLRAANPILPYKEGESCTSDGVHDDWQWESPVVTRQVIVGGVRGEQFTQQRCGGGDTMHGWRFPSKGVLVYDSALETATPYPDIEQLFQTAVWQ